jgi:hypothetical protein
MEQRCARRGTLIYLAPCHFENRKVEAMTARKRQSALVLMLLAASMLALYPTLTLEKPQSVLGGVQINAEGQAFPIGKGNGKPSNTASSASLTLSGSANVEGNEEYKLGADPSRMRTLENRYLLRGVSYAS